MARFKYMGEVERPTSIKSYGPCKVIKIPQKDGSKMVLTAPNQETGFPIGEDIGTDITDERALRVMRADARFQEIV
jgi:hypothetical protein